MNPKKKKTLQEFLSNIGKSGVTNTKDIVSAAINVLNPNLEKNTIANLARLGIDTGKLVTGDKSENNRAKLVGEFYKKRYGGIDNIGETLYNDPVGAALDLSTVIGGGGALLKGAGSVSKSSKLAKLGGLVDDAARSIDPLARVTNLIGKGGEKIADVTRKTRTGMAENLAVRSSRANPSQLSKFKDLTKKDLGEFMVEKKVLNKSAVEKAIKPLQEDYNKLVRSGKTVDGTKYADNLLKKASEIEKADRSPSARQLVESLRKEAEVQKGLGDITDTVLTNTKSNQFNKVPTGAMIDPMSDSLNKVLGEVGIKTLEDVSEGSSAVGKQLQAYRQLEEILKKQGELGKGSQLFNLFKPSVGGMIAGAGMGSFLPGVGNTLGGITGATTAIAANSPMVQRGVSSLLTNGVKIPEGIGKIISDLNTAGRAGRMNQINPQTDQSNQSQLQLEATPEGYPSNSMKNISNDKIINPQTTQNPMQSQGQIDPNMEVTLNDGSKATYGQLQQQGAFSQGEVMGAQESQAPITDEQFQQLFVADLIQNNGKNLDKLMTLQKVLTPENDIETQIKEAQLQKLQQDLTGTKKKPLTVAAENKVQLANSGLRALDSIEAMIAKDPSKVLKSNIPGKLGARDYDSAAFRAVEGLLRARSGAAIPETEVRRYMSANLPKIGDSDDEVLFKLQAFRKDLEDVAKSGGGSDEEMIKQMLGL